MPLKRKGALNNEQKASENAISNWDKQKSYYEGFSKEKKI
jgi:hypothetical protein